MRRLPERPTTELPAGLQQLLVLAHKNKGLKWYNSKSDMANAWFGATSTVTNTEMYDDWHKKFVAAKLAAVRRDPAREAANDGGIFRDRRAQAKTKNFRPIVERRRSPGRRNGRLDVDSGSDASSQDPEAEEDARRAELAAIIPVGFLQTGKPNRPQYN